MARPREYNPDKHPEAVFMLALAGFTDAEMAKALLIAESTFHKWKLDFPEFSESIREAKEDADAKVVKSLYHRALGYDHKETKVFCFDGEIITHEVTKHYPPETKAAQYWLNNRKAAKWKNKVELSGDPENPLKLTIDREDSKF